MTTALLLMELSIVSLLLGWIWVVVTGSPWPAPWAILLAAPLALYGGRKVPYSWRRLNWFDAAWWAVVAVVVAVLAEAGNALAAGQPSGARWNVQFVAGLLVAWRGWSLAEGWIDRDLIESEFQVGTLVVLGVLIAMIWVVPGAGLVSAVVFAASGLFGIGLARRAERRDPRASMESDWFVLVGGLVALIVLAAVTMVAIVTPDVLLALFEQAQSAAVLAISGIGALFAWIGSFFPTVSAPMEQPPAGGPIGTGISATPPPPREGFEGPPSWMFELFLTFFGIIFLFFIGRAIYRLTRTSVRPFRLRMTRQREPALPASTPDAFSWAHWWRTFLSWFGVWLKEAGKPGGRADRARREGIEAVAEQRSIRALYRELLTAIARAGFERQPSTTPNELRREVTSARPATSSAMSTATDLYQRARYGEEQVDRNDLARMRTAVQQARRDLSADATPTVGSERRPTER